VTWQIFVPYTPPGLNGSNGLIRAHWTKRRKMAADCLLRTLAALPSKQRIAGPLRLRYTRRYARQPLDLDNLAASIKLPLDALVKAGVLEDDNPRVISELVTRQEKVATVAEEGYSIQLEPLDMACETKSHAE
jgi:Holliday junction resolvase RusA-like endonuclease